MFVSSAGRLVPSAAALLLSLLLFAGLLQHSLQQEDQRFKVRRVASVAAKLPFGVFVNFKQRALIAQKKY